MNFIEKAQCGSSLTSWGSRSRPSYHIESVLQRIHTPTRKTLTACSQHVSYLLKTYATDEVVEEAETDVVNYEQLGCPLVDNLRYPKMTLRRGKVHDVTRLNRNFKERLYHSIRSSMKKALSRQRNWHHTKLGRLRYLFFELQEGPQISITTSQAEAHSQKSCHIITIVNDDRSLQCQSLASLVLRKHYHSTKHHQVTRPLKTATLWSKDKNDTRRAHSSITPQLQTPQWNAREYIAGFTYCHFFLDDIHASEIVPIAPRELLVVLFQQIVSNKPSVLVKSRIRLSEGDYNPEAQQSAQV